MLQRFKGSLFGRDNKGVGIEVAPERISVAQVRTSEKGYQLKSLVTREVPEGVCEEGRIVDPGAVAELIQSILETESIKAKRVTASVPMRDSIVRLIPIPAELDDAELRDIVLNQEAALYLPYPREEVDLDYQKLGYFEDEDGIEKVQVLLVATRREVTDTYLDIFRRANLEVGVLEINSFALIRTIREQLRQFGSSDAAVLVDIEFDSTELAIIVDGIPQFNRTVPIGTYQLQSALSRAMNLPPTRNTEHLQEMTIPVPTAEAQRGDTAPLNPGMNALQRGLGELADEIRRSIDFYLSQSEGVEVAHILLAGPGGGIGQLDEFFSHRLGVPTTQIDPIATLSLQTNLDIPAIQRPGLGTVLGLGLREV
ncbi:type IV pilus assembly protein PilM [Rubidibacter lacunae KORDI 51-2]|uniref:Type IV pilus assembly protein PilM n=1 Tax=Rubidibacter lacunae KORDI 51-2 TaxID=582515 RepID=U5DEW4_9CHRO|nr:type IV pilus assembly protein PilM [Rubidibacter lacunae]ERN43038.1 type IV pilus assembly protein PilM [Rubidibacter lacunae KORDI 51-2]